MEIQNPTIQAEKHPLYTHQANKTISGSYEGGGNLCHLVSGRHVDNVDQSVKSKEGPCSGSGTLVSLEMVVNIKKSVMDPTQSQSSDCDRLSINDKSPFLPGS